LRQEVEFVPQLPIKAENQQSVLISAKKLSTALGHDGVMPQIYPDGFSGGNHWKIASCIIVEIVGDNLQ
jgi:hypothetical protein